MGRQLLQEGKYKEKEICHYFLGRTMKRLLLITVLLLSGCDAIWGPRDRESWGLSASNRTEPRISVVIWLEGNSEQHVVDSTAFIRFDNFDLRNGRMLQFHGTDSEGNDLAQVSCRLVEEDDGLGGCPYNWAPDWIVIEGNVEDGFRMECDPSVPFYFDNC